jgi:hypothetical protein
MKRKATIPAVAVAVIGLALAGPAFAHGTGAKAAPGAVSNPCAGGMGGGMSGQKGGMSGQKGGMGGGMMGGMSRQGAMLGHMLFGGAPLRPMTTERVTAIVTGMLAMHGPDTLKVGKVLAKGDSIIAEVVTKDGSLVEKIEFNKKTGEHHAVK